MSVAWSVALAGLGAVLGAAVTLALEQVRWRLAQSKRWDERRRESYTSFAAAAKRETRICLRIVASRYEDDGPRVPPLDIVAGRPQLQEAADKRAELFEDLLLLGDRAVVESARTWQENNRELQRLVDAPTWADESEFIEAFRVTGTARDSFFRAAREHLGVSGDVVVPTDWTWHPSDGPGPTPPAPPA
jgi:hypothetical protein